MSLGVFDALESGPKSASALATDLKLDAGALERLLDACVGLQLLGRQGVHYENTPTASAYLCKQSPTRMTGYLNYSNEILWKMWGNLEGAIREGTNRWQETFGWDGPIFSSFFKTEAAMREFLMGMHGQGLLSSPHGRDGFRPEPVSSPGRSGGSDRPPGHRRLRALSPVSVPWSSIFRKPGPCPRDRWQLTGREPDRNHRGRLLRG